MADEVVSITWSDLMDPSVDLTDAVEKAYGSHGLGILTVSGVPGYVELRRRLLPLAERVANLPEHVRLSLEDPGACFNNGWSHGKEMLQNGRRDSLKGSFYANPAQDTVSEAPALVDAFPEFYTCNRWPNSELPELQPAFMQLGQLIMCVGESIVELCDAYVHCKRTAQQQQQQQQQQDEPPPGLARTLRSSRCPKGRLLHYFPLSADDLQGSADQDPDQWCGWHKDHGSLTGLTSAMYLRGGLEVAKPDNSAGLYIASRPGLVVKVSIPDDHIAYQVGEAMQIQSGGLLRATPHCVRGPSTATSLHTSRNTLAVFMQPDPMHELAAPAGMPAAALGVEGYRHGMTFGEFAKLRNARYYKSVVSPCKQQAGGSSGGVQHGALCVQV